MAVETTIGLDLGATNSFIAVQRRGEIDIVPNNTDLGRDSFPNYIVSNKGDLVFGSAAKNQSHQRPGNYVSELRRFIGQSTDNPFVRNQLLFAPFHATTSDQQIKIKLEGQEYTGDELYARTIAYLKSAAEEHLGVKVKNVAVTIPPSFNDKQKASTVRACHQAGFHGVQLIEDPIAAVAAFSLFRLGDNQKKFLVFDLGGTSLCVSVVLEDEGKLSILCSKNENDFGGKTFDSEMTQYCLQQFERMHGVDISAGTSSSDSKEMFKAQSRLQRLRLECEKQKCALSFTPQVTVSVESVFQGTDLVVPFTQTLFTSLNKHHFQRCTRILEHTLASAGITTNEITHVILAGGSVRIPALQLILQDFLGKSIELSRITEPDEIGAVGALMEFNNLGSSNRTVPNFHYLPPAQVQDKDSNTTEEGGTGSVGKLVLLLTQSEFQVKHSQKDDMETSEKTRAVIKFPPYIVLDEDKIYLGQKAKDRRKHPRRFNIFKVLEGENTLKEVEIIVIVSSFFKALRRNLKLRDETVEIILIYPVNATENFRLRLKEAAVLAGLSVSLQVPLHLVLCSSLVYRNSKGLGTCPDFTVVVHITKTDCDVVLAGSCLESVRILRYSGVEDLELRKKFPDQNRKFIRKSSVSSQPDSIREVLSFYREIKDKALHDDNGNSITENGTKKIYVVLGKGMEHTRPHLSKVLRSPSEFLFESSFLEDERIPIMEAVVSAWDTISKKDIFPRDINIYQNAGVCQRVAKKNDPVPSHNKMYSGSFNNLSNYGQYEFSVGSKTSRRTYRFSFRRHHRQPANILVTVGTDGLYSMEVVDSKDNVITLVTV